MAWYVAAVLKFGIVQRWRKYRTVKLAIANAKRNQKAGHLAWVERENSPAVREGS